MTNALAIELTFMARKKLTYCHSKDRLGHQVKQLLLAEVMLFPKNLPSFVCCTG